MGRIDLVWFWWATGASCSVMLIFLLYHCRLYAKERDEQEDEEEKPKSKPQPSRTQRFEEATCRLAVRAWENISNCW